MTKEDLKQIPALRCEIKILRSEIDLLKPEIVSDVVKDYRTGYPHPIIISGYSQSEYEKKKSRLEKKLKRKEAELRALEQWIEDLEDSGIRNIISLKYGKCLSWNEIAAKIGNRNTADSVRKKAERFLNKLQ